MHTTLRTRLFIALIAIATTLAPVTLALGPTLSTQNLMGVGPIDVPDSECTLPLIDDKCEAWAVEVQVSFKMEPSPDGTVLYIDNLTAPTDLGVSAFDAKTGEWLWTSHDADDAPPLGRTMDITVTPDGEHVALAGGIDGPTADERDMVAAVFDAATGEHLWTASYDRETSDRATGIAATEDAIYITGRGGVVAYDLESGSELWSHSREELQDGVGDLADVGFLINAAPNGNAVYVATRDASEGPERAIAFDAQSGEVLWDSPAPDGSPRYVLDFDLSPDGRTVILAAGQPVGSVTAFDTSDGEILWHTQMDTLPIVSDSFLNPYGTAFHPDSQTVYVQATEGYVYSTEPAYVLAYDARTGAQTWTHIEPGGHYSGWGSRAIDVSPDGSTVYTSFRAAYPGFVDLALVETTVRVDLATLALDGDSGERKWKAGFPSTSPNVLPLGTFVSPDGSHVYALQVGSPELIAYELDGSGGLPSPLVGGASQR